MNNSNQMKEYYFTTLISFGQMVIGCNKSRIWKLFPNNEIIDYKQIPEKNIDECWVEIYFEDAKLLCVLNETGSCINSMFFFDYKKFDMRSFIEYCNKYFISNSFIKGWEIRNYSLTVVPCHDDIAFIFTKSE